MPESLRHLLISLKTTIRLYKYWVNPISVFRFVLCIQRQARQSEKLTEFHSGRIRFSVRYQDWFALEEIFLEREYDFIEKNFGKTSLKSVVDVGANIGLFSIYILSKWPSTNIYSVEPGENTYRLLEQNQKTNSTLNWQTIQYALWKEDGTVNFEDKDYSTSSRINFNSEKINIVPAISLATLLSRNIILPIDIMKLDIEGAEESALSGSREALQAINTLIVEIHPQLCDQNRVVTILRESFRFLYYVPNRRSSKPLLVASRKTLSLPVFQD